MKKNKQIENFINQYRKSEVIRLLFQRIFYGLIILTLLLILFTSLEKIVYFDSDNRTRIVILVISIILTLILLIGAHFLYGIKGKIKHFSNEAVAKNIGLKNKFISDKLINAYQLKNITPKSKLAEKLREFAFNQIGQKISNVTIESNTHIFKTKPFIMLIIIICFSILSFDNEFSSAKRRLLNPSVEYDIPLPFAIIDLTDNTFLLEGDSLNIIFQTTGKTQPDSVNIKIDDTNKITSKKIASHDNAYTYTVKNIENDFIYWAEYESNNYLTPWERIESTKKKLKVIKRPRINSIDFTVTPPLYSNLDPTYYSANNTDIPMLQGSTLKLDAISNKEIQYAWILVDSIKKDLYLNEVNIKGQINIDKDSRISLMCEDYNGIKNINPPTNRINIIPDNSPQIFVANPETEFIIDDNRLIILDMQIIDDFGFSSSWIEYKIIRPEYLYSDSNIYKYDITNIDFNLKAQRVVNEWDISTYSLAPEEKIEFYLLVADNNNITGPSVSKLGPFVGNIPSLEDLFENIISMENDVMESTEEIALTVDDVYELVDELEKEMLKSDEISWEQTQKINETSDKINDILDEIESISEALENIQEEIENNDLVDQNLIDKFNEFQELLNSIMTPEMMETLNKIQEMMNKMSTDQMLGEIQNLKQDVSMLDEQLDRFIELFERAMAEQLFDEFIKHLEEMLTNQLNISNDIIKNDPKFSELELKQKQQKNDFNSLEESINKNIQTISKFSSKAGEQLSELMNSELIEKTKNDLEKTENTLNNMDASKSFSNSENSIDNLSEVLNQIEKIKEQFDRESVSEMTVEFISLIRNIESISFDQEAIINEAYRMNQYNPKWENIAFKENIIQNKIIKFIEQLIELTNKTLHIPPGVNKTIGSAQLAIQKSISLIEQTRTNKVRKENQKALNAINETAYILITSLDKMQETMSASGMESYLEQLEEMAKGQQQINQGTGQCMMPGGGMPGQGGMQEALMKRLQSQQQKLQKQLGEMLSDNPGGETGGLPKALEDKEEVINDLKRKKINRETIDRQENILSRMLDSQKSLKQKDFNEKRKSKTAEVFNYDGPISLPEDRGERQTILTNALDDALNQGYSTDYQVVLKKYFKYLEQADE